MKYIKKFNTLDEYNQEENSLYLPNVSWITDGDILKYKNIKEYISDGLILWYNPSRQGLNNHDVIESYTEDFTK